MHPAIREHDAHLEQLIDTLGNSTPPAECNGFALSMRDSVVCLLKGQRIQLQHSTSFNWPAAFAVVGSVATASVGVLGIARTLCK